MVRLTKVREGAAPRWFKKLNNMCTNNVSISFPPSFWRRPGKIRLTCLRLDDAVGALIKKDPTLSLLQWKQVHIQNVIIGILAGRMFAVAKKEEISY